MGQQLDSVRKEFSILKEFQSSNCSHLPEIVWSPSGGQQLGIVPSGKPIEFREAQSVSRKIVIQLMDGLEFLHNLGSVHQDICPSNLILHSSESGINLVIIDYENAVLVKEVSNGVDYFGGFISWPIRLLKSNDSNYIPTPEDDLLHMLFPQHFGSFSASKIGTVDSDKQLRLIKLWEDIEKSRVWGSFLKAANE